MANVWKNVKSPPHIIGGMAVSDGSIKNAIDPPIAVVEEKFSNMNIDGPPIEVRKYPEESDNKVLTDALLAYDSEYRRYI